MKRTLLDITKKLSRQPVKIKCSAYNLTDSTYAIYNAEGWKLPDMLEEMITIDLSNNVIVTNNTQYIPNNYFIVERYSDGTLIKFIKSNFTSTFSSDDDVVIHGPFEQFLNTSTTGLVAGTYTGTGEIACSDLYSNDACTVINLMSNLSTTQESAIATFIDSQVLSGNWALVKEFQQFAGLGNEANGKLGWKGLRNAENVGCSWDNTNGLNCDGVSTRINTKVQQNDLDDKDHGFGIYFRNYDYVSGNNLMSGRADFVSGEAQFQLYANSTTRWYYRTQTRATAQQNPFAMSSGLIDNTWTWYGTCLDSGFYKWWTGLGDEIRTNHPVATDATLGSHPHYVGCHAYNEVTFNSFTKMDCLSHIAITYTGFDFTSWKTNYAQFLTDLGI